MIPAELLTFDASLNFNMKRFGALGLMASI